MKSESQQKIEKKGGSHVAIGVATALSGHDRMVQIFPTDKEWYGADGRGPYRLTDPSAVVQRSLAPELIKFAMIDRDHARQLAPEGTPVKAAGWFSDYEVRQDGTIWGRPDWTAKGQEELDNREYRYFSATFQIDRNTREILAITGGTITNTPNFQTLQALASQEKKTTPQPQEETYMKPELIALAKALGLDHEKNSEEEILAAAQKSHEALGKLQEDVANMKKRFKVEETADFATLQKTVETAVEETAAKSKASDIDPEKYVPKEMYDELATRMDKIEKTATQKSAETAVETAMKEGKIAPAQKDWAIDYATQNLDGFQQFVSKQPKIVGDETAAAKQHQEENGGLSQEDVEVAKQLGIDPEDLKKDKEKNKAA